MRFSRKSIPTVDINLLLNEPSVYRYKKVVLPTPESPVHNKQISVMGTINGHNNRQWQISVLLKRNINGINGQTL